MAAKGKKGRSRKRKRKGGATPAPVETAGSVATSEADEAVAEPPASATAVDAVPPADTPPPTKRKKRKSAQRRPRRKKEPEPEAPTPPTPTPRSEAEAPPAEPGPPAPLGDDVDVFDLDADLAAPPDDAAPVVFDLDEEAETTVKPAVAALIADVTNAEPIAAAEPADAASEPSGPAVHGATAEATDPAAADIERKEAANEVEDLDADLGPTSTPEARARILAAALAHAEMQEARYRVPSVSRRTARIKAALALVSLAMAGLIALVPPPLVVPAPPPTLSTADRDRGARLALLLQAEQIEAFRAVEGRLPTSLGEVGASVPGLRYVRSSNRLYQLVAYTEDGRAIVYDSSAPAPEFGALSPRWKASGGS